MGNILKPTPSGRPPMANQTLLCKSSKQLYNFMSDDYRQFITPYMGGQTRRNSIRPFRGPLCRHTIFCKFIIAYANFMKLWGGPTTQIQVRPFIEVRMAELNKRCNVVKIRKLEQMCTTMKKSLQVGKQLLYDGIQIREECQF